MLRLFNDLTKTVEENIVIAIIKSFEEKYSGKIIIFGHQKLFDNLISLISKTINPVEYNKLKWKEQDKLISIIINAMATLAKNSINKAPSYTYNTSWISNEDKYNITRYDGEFRGATDIYKVKGLEFLTREKEGWYYDDEWDELKFPDVFYDPKMQHILQTTIFNAIKSTKYSTVFLNVKQLHKNNDNNPKTPGPTVSNSTSTAGLDLEQYASELTKLGLLPLPSYSAATSQRRVFDFSQYAAELHKYGLFQLPSIDNKPNQNNVEMPSNQTRINLSKN